MGRKCAVPHCYTGYRKCKEKASLYRVPDDDFFLSKWQEAIAREDRPITPKDYVCEKHFKDDDILRRRIIRDVVEEYQRPRLKPDAIPSIFPDLPEFILKMVKKRRKMPVESPKKEANNSLDTSEEKDKTENEIAENDVIEEVKTEPLDTNDLEPAPSSESSNENILSNEIDIKSESEETIVDPIENNTENSRIELNFGPKMHRCNQCDYQTKYAHNLRTHKTKHLTGDNAYLHCEHCPNYKTKWELTLRNHLKIKHGIGKQEVFKCTLCQFETKVKLCLKRHYERHNRGIFDKKLSCTFPGCDFKEDSKTVFDLHILSHNCMTIYEQPDESTLENKKSFKCTECLYETNSKTHIIRHIKSAHNTGDDTIVSVAGKHKSPLMSEFVETGPKDKSLYKCLKCPYKSSSRTNLLTHVFRHKYPTTQKNLKAKIWKCPKCPYATFFQHALKKHRQTGCEDVYLCADCNYKSRSKPDYIKHTLTHRNISIETVSQNGIICGEAEKVFVEPDIQQNDEEQSDEYQNSELSEVVYKQDEDCLTTAQDVKQQGEGAVDTSPIPEFVSVNVKEESHTDEME